MRSRHEAIKLVDPQRTRLVAAPAPEGALDLDGTGGRVQCRGRERAPARSDLRRFWAVDRVTLAELSLGVLPPAPQGRVGLQAAPEATALRNRRPGRGRSDLGGSVGEARAPAPQRA